MEAKVAWKGRMSFTGTADSGFEVPIGSDESVGGDNDAPRPMELLALSLAGCTAMDVLSILVKKKQVITAFEVQVHASRAQEHPKVFTEAVIEYLVTGKGVEEVAVRRSIELSATRYCPAQAMLNPVMPMRLIYSIFEESSQGERVLVKSGEYIPSLEGAGSETPASA